jgi:DUF438 domain-containing protein
MTTKAQKIAALKAEYPTLKTGSDETGYTQLNEKEYKDMIESWAENEIAQEAEAAYELEKENARLAILEKLGVTSDEVDLLLK